MGHAILYEWVMSYHMKELNHIIWNVIPMRLDLGKNPILNSVYLTGSHRIFPSQNHPCQAKCNDSFIYTWLIHTYDIYVRQNVMTHLYLRDSFIFTTIMSSEMWWLIHIYDMTRLCSIRDTNLSFKFQWDILRRFLTSDWFVYMTWHIHVWDMTHSYI